MPDLENGAVRFFLASPFFVYFIGVVMRFRRLASLAVKVLRFTCVHASSLRKRDVEPVLAGSHVRRTTWVLSAFSFLASIS